MGNNKSRSRPLCPLGHEMKLSNNITTWMCDGAKESRGCLCGPLSVENVASQQRYKCDEGCNFDYCGPCYNAKITIYSKIENETSKHIIETRPKYKIKDDNNIPIATSIVNDSNNSTEDDTNRNTTQNQKYSVTIPNDVIEGDLMVILVDNEEMIVNCREGKKSGDTIIISEDELIPQIYVYTVPEDIVVGEEYTVLINIKEINKFWNVTDEPGQLCVATLPRKKKTRNAYDDIEKYGEMLCGYAANGNITDIKILCARADIRKFINYQDNKHGCSALSYSCSKGYRGVVSLLISRGAIINIVENDGFTPLYAAVANGHIELVSLLISEGADVNLRIRSGQSPLYEASYDGHSEIVDMLIDSGADVNSLDIQGAAALHLASQNGYIKIVRKLLSSGAKVGWKSRNGLSPLMAARNMNHKEVIEILTNAEAAESEKNKNNLENKHDKLNKKNDEIENRNRKHLEDALKRGKQKWNRSKIMIVGDGRAGKTALTRSMMVEPFEDTPSTAGINNITCDVKYASIEGECGEWVLYNKPEKELEASLARMIAAQQQQQQPMMDPQEVAKVEFVAELLDMGMDNSLIQDILFEEKVFTSTLIPNREVKSMKVDVDDALVMKYLGEIKSSKLTLSIYDYGGQEVFNTIHHLFLTRLGVYVIVFSMEQMISKDENIRRLCLDNISFWMNSILVQTRCLDDGCAPIVLVGTHRDCVCNFDDQIAISDLLEARFAFNDLAWPKVQHCAIEIDNINIPLCFFPVDNTKSRGDTMIIQLMSKIDNVVSNSGYVNEEKPLSWIKLFDQMKSCGEPCLSVEKVCELAQENGLDLEEVNSVLMLFHEMGELMWHNEDGLRDVIILDAVNYFVRPVTRIICNHFENKDGNKISHTQAIHRKCRAKHPKLYERMVNLGIASETLFSFLLEGSEIATPLMINMMVKYGLIIFLHNLGENEYLVPALLPIYGISETMTSFKDLNTYKQSCFIAFSTSRLFDKQWQSCNELSSKGFLPRGLFERLLCKIVYFCMQTESGPTLDEIVLLRNFAKLRYHKQVFTLRALPEINCMELKVSHGYPHEILRPVLKHLELIATECFKSLYFTVLLAPGDQVAINATPLLNLEKLKITMSRGLDLQSHDKSKVLFTNSEIIVKFAVWVDNSGDALDKTVDVTPTEMSSGDGVEFFSQNLPKDMLDNANAVSIIDSNIVPSFESFESYSLNDVYMTFRGCNPRMSLLKRLSNRMERYSRIGSVKLVGESVNEFGDTLFVAMRNVKLIVALLTTDFMDFLRLDLEGEVNYNLLEWLLALICCEASGSQTVIFPVLLFSDCDMFNMSMIPEVHPKATIDECSLVLNSHGLCSPWPLDAFTARDIVKQLVERERYCRWDCPVNTALEVDICNKLAELNLLT